MFLVILLILFGFFELWRQPLLNATILLKDEAKQPIKSFGKNAEILQMGLCDIALKSISFAMARSVMANGYQAVANAAGCLAALAKPIFRDLGSGKTVRETLQNRYFENQELSRDTKSIMTDFGDRIKCTVTISTFTLRVATELVSALPSGSMWDRIEGVCQSADKYRR